MPRSPLAHIVLRPSSQSRTQPLRGGFLFLPHQTQESLKIPPRIIRYNDAPVIQSAGHLTNSAPSGHEKLVPEAAQPVQKTASIIWRDLIFFVEFMNISNGSMHLKTSRSADDLLP